MKEVRSQHQARLVIGLLLAVFSCQVFRQGCDAVGQQNHQKVSEDLDDENFELEAIPLEDAYDLLTELEERRPYNPALGDNRTFGVIVDCGSSGTRAHLYEWNGNLSYPELLHDIEPMRDDDRKPLSKKFSPSLASFADDSSKELEAYIRKILDYIESYIPKKSHPFTGVYLLATAGMRLLDEETQMRIMKNVSSYIKREYNFAKVKTSVISGADEGMYQWISVNAKAKRFLSQGTSGKTKTFAIIEMGGASAQVTYQLRPGVCEYVSSSLSDQEHVKVFRAQMVEPKMSRHDKPENTYLLHSTTFLGFGSNSAHEAYLDLLIHKHSKGSNWRKFVDWSKKFLQSCFEPSATLGDDDNDGLYNPKANNELIIEDPCLPDGYVSEEPMRKPREILTKKSDKILGHLLDEDEPYFNYTLKGTGSYNKCKRLVEEMLKLSKQEKFNCKDEEGPEKCTMSLIGEPFIPFDSIDFLGIGDIYYTTNLMLRSAGVYDHKKVARRTKRICNSSYSKLQKEFSQLYNDPKLRSRVSDECFKAIWVDTFLIKALGMPSDLSSLKTVGQINKDALEWTLGAVLDKSLDIEEAAEENAEQIFGQVTRSYSGIAYDEPVEEEDEEDELDLGLDD